MPLNFVPKLSLTSKGLIIIIIPLIFQIAFLTFYLKILSDTDQIVSAEERAKNVIGRLNWISALVMAADLGATGYRLTGDKRLFDTLKYAEPRLEREVKETSELLSTDPAEAGMINDVGAEIKSLLLLLNSETAEKNQALSKQKLSADDEANIAKIQKLFALRHDIFAREAANHSFSIAHTPQSRHNNSMYITMGIFADAVAALIVFFIFSRTITSRLAVLTSNLGRFSKGIDLHPLVGGNDEVAVLDSNFHEMTLALKVAQQRKKEYLQMLSHDLRTPISNVLLALEMIEKIGGGEKREKNHLDSAERNLKRALGLINQILEIETMEAGAISLNYDALTTTELCAKAIESVKYLALERGIQIEKHDNAIDFVADIERLLRVLINLLGNAIKFSPDQSKIIVSCESSNETVKVRVIDQGRGIPAESIGRVFERFQQVRAEDQKVGSGLGLAVCRAIVEAHGGTIGVESTEGVGSIFWFELPEEPAS